MTFLVQFNALSQQTWNASRRIATGARRSQQIWRDRKILRLTASFIADLFGCAVILARTLAKQTLSFQHTT